jgi:DNA-binding transcriptional ArsR family regulator
MLNNQPVDKVFRALGDPTRRAIVERLSRGSASAGTLVGPLDITLAAVVQHLQVLEESGLVRTQKIGRVRTCHIQPEGLQLAERWIAERRALWERRLDRLGEILAAPDASSPASGKKPRKLDKDRTASKASKEEKDRS